MKVGAERHRERGPRGLHPRRSGGYAGSGRGQIRQGRREDACFGYDIREGAGCDFSSWGVGTWGCISALGPS